MLRQVFGFEVSKKHSASGVVVNIEAASNEEAETTLSDVVRSMKYIFFRPIDGKSNDWKVIRNETS